MRPLDGRTPDHAADAIAIIGMSGRFPGAPDPDALWTLLVDGRDAVAEAPADRPWMWELYDPEPRKPGRLPTRRGGFLEGVDQFDAEYFHMSAREAHRTDPQLRLLLEIAHEAVEDAGVPVDRLSRLSTGVFVGSISVDYWIRQLTDLAGLDLYSELGARCHAALSGRLSYAFDLHGPALTVDTACSSSLTTVHLACQSLRTGECDLALAGGVNLLLTPYSFITLGWAGALSPDGRCKFADAAADGFVRGEAVGMVVLKPLAQALADGDRVRAVILGSAVNNNGFNGAGMMAPDVAGQMAVMRAAYANAGVNPRDVAYVEAHGTGTLRGDEIELTALSRVMGPREGVRRCLVGSAKTSVGHAEGASGVTALIKTVLCLEHGLVPGNPLLRTPTPVIDWDTGPLRVPARPTTLPSDDGTVLAGVNSFGASGANAHLVLGSAPPSSPPHHGTDRNGTHLLTLSARSASALRELAERYTALLTGPDAPELDSLCVAAARRRRHGGHRIAVTADSAAELAAGLHDALAGIPRPGTAISQQDGVTRPRVVFVFPGQGAQWQGMGRTLLNTSSAFGDALRSCDAVIAGHGGWSLLDALQGDDDSWLAETAKVQPALWAMGVALAAQWRTWGVEPDAVVGQSQGEIAAAHCAGALTLEQAGQLSCLRATLIDELAPPGAMVWLKIPPAELPDLLHAIDAAASIAVLESSESVVLSGAVDEIEKIATGCENLDIPCQRVQVGYAAHSSRIDPVREPLMAGLAGLVPSATTVPFLSTVTGTKLPGTRLDSTYWWRNLRETVQLEPVVRNQVGGTGPVVFLQMSPHPLLSRAIQDTASGCSHVTVLGSLSRQYPEWEAMYESIAVLYAQGCAIRWDQVHAGPAPFVVLPRYPWQRSSYWHEPADSPWPPITSLPVSSSATASKVAPPSHPSPAADGHPLLGAAVREGPDTYEWSGPVDWEANGFLLEHRVAGKPVMPGTAFLELAGAAAARIATDRPLLVTAAEFCEILPLDEDLRLTVTAERDQDSWQLSIATHAGSRTERTEHACAVLRPASPATTEVPAGPVERIRLRCVEHMPGERFYQEQAAAGNAWRGAFRGVLELWLGQGETLALVQTVPCDGYDLHPATLDSCLQPIVTLSPDSTRRAARGFVLLGVARMHVHRRAGAGPLWSHIRLAETDSADVTADVTVTDAAGELVVSLTGVTGRVVTAAHPPSYGVVPAGTSSGRGGTTTAEPADSYRTWMHEVRWEEASLGQVPTPAGRWVLLCGGTELDTRFTDSLTAAGCTVVTVRYGRGYAAEGPDRFRVAPGCRPDLVRALETASESVPIRGVISLWAFTTGAGENSTPEEMDLAVADICGTAITAASALLSLEQPQPPRLILVTRGAQAVVADDRCPAAWQSALWGLGRVLSREHPQFATLLIDLPDPTEQASETSVTTDMLLAPGPENQLALRAGRCLAPRLLPGDNRCAAAVTPPMAYGTAYHALIDLAHLQPGERVLIDSADDEVALACLHVARWCGATVYVTTDKPAGRDLPLPPGAELRADPSALADELRDSGREGVDVIVRTQSGQTTNVDHSLLDRFGRYVDLAASHATPDRSVSMALFTGGRSYLPVNMRALESYAPRRLGMVLRTVADLLDKRQLPPTTRQAHPVSEAAEALSRAAVSGNPDEHVLAARRKHNQTVPAPCRIHADATYLITGGASGIGALFARWLINQGARHLLLTGRTAFPAPGSSDERGALIAQLRETGARIEYAAVDVADQISMGDLLRRRSQEKLPPVAGVAHCAAVVAPSRLCELTDDDLHDTLHPKVAGTWALHQLFTDRSLDFFILFSSCISLLGGLSVGWELSAYAAGNAFVDALARRRRSAGLPATAVNWGYWSQVGLAARLSAKAEHDVRPAGMAPIRPEDAPGLFARMIDSPHSQLMVLPTDWPRYAAAYPVDASNPLLCRLLPSDQTAPVLNPGQPAPSSPQQQATTVSPGTPAQVPESPSPVAHSASANDGHHVAEPALEDYLAGQLAGVLGLEPDEISRTKPMNRLGMDSLMAMEVRTRLRRDRGIDVPVSRLLTPICLPALVAELVSAQPSALSSGAPPT